MLYEVTAQFFNLKMKKRIDHGLLLGNFFALCGCLVLWHYRTQLFGSLSYAFDQNREVNKKTLGRVFERTDGNCHLQ